ncbi:DegT/DnrJ/EryC1/StrS family aminotransferase [Clostridiaceae bacterium]|nr:DegT/DnrJ/EryC1/StrS family aminotransferase [Clostridiaceae bacterium]RKI12928.1 DegT/DnrJ/EryC1/StrS family aminotransferase [bacterium 1XD21-70]
MRTINYMEPSYDEHEIHAVNEYMNSKAWLTEFKKTREFEESIASFTGAEYCSVMSNGTVTLIASLMACGIRPGDEVIVPDFTMSATSHAVEILGARAVFADVEKDTFCMDYNAMIEAVNEKTRAVIVVDLNGRYPKRFEDIITFCRRHGLWMIEDAAQALGSTYKGKALGTFGDIGSFSFSMPKIITTGQGGAIVTNNKELYDKILRIRDFGREEAGSDHYLMIGANFKFTDLQAVIGMEQMKKVPARVARKKQMGRLYDEGLKNVKGIETVNNHYDDTAPCFIEILCDQRDGLIEWLSEHGIKSRKFYPALHSEPAYGRDNLKFPIAQEISSRGLWLPSSVNVTDGEIEYICNCIKAFCK